jgi:hypothetical protein
VQLRASQDGVVLSTMEGAPLAVTWPVPGGFSGLADGVGGTVGEVPGAALVETASDVGVAATAAAAGTVATMGLSATAAGAATTAGAGTRSTASRTVEMAADP